MRQTYQGNGYAGYQGNGNYGEVPAGHFELIPGSGIYIPNSGTLLEKAGQEAGKTVLKSVATSPGTVQASQQAAAETAGQKFYTFMREKPVVFWGSVAGITLLVGYGAYQMMKK